MNSHQRRKASRRAHMLLPLSAAIDLRPLIGRTVYVYGRHGINVELTANLMHGVVSGRVTRHLFNKHHAGSGEHAGVDILLTHKNGTEESVRTTMRGLRLKNKADRAPRPYWVNLRRAHREKTTHVDNNND